MSTHNPSRRRSSLLLLSVLALAACSSNSEREPVIGEAFVGPASLQIRQDLSARSALVATGKHGEHLDIIGRRRRFLKVRTRADSEGWVDGRMLLSPDAMSDLKRLAERAAEAPSQGRATVFEPLNVHTVPNRQSPSFFQIATGEQVDVIAHDRFARVPFNPPDIIAEQPLNQLVKKAARRKKAEPEIPPPPPGKPPALPADWVALSQPTRRPVPAPAPAPSAGKDAHPAEVAAPPMSDWTLVRAKDGRSGWVLDRMLFMALPDDVAQHAERARITSYFVIGSQNDHGTERPVWLWTTLAQTGTPCQFDSMRIFVWNMRRHRYETSFVERNLKGYLPLLVEGGPSGNASGFRVVVEEKDGSLKQREYALSNFHARVVSRDLGKLPASWYVQPAGRGVRQAPPPPQAEPPWQDKAKGLFDNIKGRLKR